MSIGTVLLYALALLCLFSVGERACVELGWPCLLAAAVLVVAAVLQTQPIQIRVAGGTISPIGAGFVLLSGFWAACRCLARGERALRLGLSVLLCGLWMLLLLMLWNRQDVWGSLLPGAACGALAALVADSRTGTIACALLGALTANVLFFSYSLVTGGIGMLELGTGYGWTLTAVALWCAIWLYELKDALKRFVIIKLPNKRKT